MNEKKAKAMRRALRVLPSRPMEETKDGSMRYPDRSRERIYHDVKRAAR